MPTIFSSHPHCVHCSLNKKPCLVFFLFDHLYLFKWNKIGHNNTKNRTYIIYTSAWIYRPFSLLPYQCFFSFFSSVPACPYYVWAILAGVKTNKILPMASSQQETAISVGEGCYGSRRYNASLCTLIPRVQICRHWIKDTQCSICAHFS